MSTTTTDRLTIHVLLVEDNPADARLVEEALKDATVGVDFRVSLATTLRGAIALLEEERPDVVLLDLGLPDCERGETYPRLRQAGAAVPTVVLSGLDDEAHAAETIRQGAQDYLAKSRLEGQLLSRSLRYAIERGVAQREHDLQVADEARRAAAEDAVRERDTFLSVAAHELKTPITSLTVAVQLLLRLNRRAEPVVPEVLDRHLTIVDQQVRKLADMVGRVLDVSRVRVGQLTLNREPADVGGIVQNAVALVTARAGTRTFAMRSAAGGPIIAEVDPLRLEQVLTNLLDNCIQFSPDGSEIKIELAADGDRLSITVRDRGLGIALEHRELVFERFYQAHQRPHSPGLGLGLYICKQIVELHGGTIAAIGPADDGATVVITLPLSAPPSSEAPPVLPRVAAPSTAA